MARSRRRSSSKAVRKRTDWVYRSNQRASTVAPLSASDSFGTYEFQVRNLSTGGTNAQCLWLIDAADRKMSVSSISSTTFSLQSQASQPEPRRTKVLAVEGIIYVEPQTWAVGNLMSFGYRIGAFEQDITSGLAAIDPDMTMWQTPGAGAQLQLGAAAYYANDKQLCMAEHRAFKSFGDNGSIMIIRVRHRLRWTLQSHHGLGLWIEGETTSVNVRYQTWLRTLVEVV